MSFTPRFLAWTVVTGGVAAIAFASPASADPDIHNQSAATVIDQFQKEGYAVEVNGAPAGDSSLLSTCTVTSVRKPGGTTISLSVACPLIHG
jgi:hypothetical protein